MKSIGVVTDSHSSISQKEAGELGIWVLPMPFFIEEECYYEDVTLTREELFCQLEKGAKVNTSQPVPGTVMEIWDQALKVHDEIVYLPMSSGLSGSCATAMALAQEEPYEGRVFVVDHGRIATPLHRSVLDALELIQEGYGAEEIKEMLEAAKDQMIIYLGVETLDYLKRGGRISAAAAAVGSVLHIKPILSLGVGTLDVWKKCRGFHQARRTMLKALKQDMEKYLQTYKKEDIALMAASSASEEETLKWIEEIQAAFPGMEILSDPLSLGVCCHTGPGALGVGFSCRPGRK